MSKQNLLDDQWALGLLGTRSHRALGRQALGNQGTCSPWHSVARALGRQGTRSQHLLWCLLVLETAPQVFHVFNKDKDLMRLHSMDVFTSETVISVKLYIYWTYLLVKMQNNK